MNDDIKYALGEAMYMIEGGTYEIFSDKKYASIYMFATENVHGVVSSLNIANKVMPIYKEAKPIIKTVSNTYKNIKTQKRG